MIHHRRSGWEELYGLLRDVFCGSAIACFLWAMHRIATSLKTEARLRALEQAGDIYTVEEREELFAKIRARTLQL